MALVGFLACMNPHVNLESGGRCTLLGAELARPLVLPSVHQNVIVVLGLFRKPKGTELTLEGVRFDHQHLKIVLFYSLPGWR